MSISVSESESENESKSESEFTKNDLQTGKNSIHFNNNAIISNGINKKYIFELSH